ncbi:hypothetical protein F4801DRAFT_534504 [Xylaria longipes]|nr:hypothetical protein F4801DRAFT_534504 [Xylaria longipes]
MSNLGPLLTDILASSGCKGALENIYYVDNNYLVQGNIDQVTCYPNGYAGNTAQYYSPARCPSGFTQACSNTNRIDTLVETISICCPTQHIFVCQSTSSLTWESTLGCVSQNTRVQTLDVIVASDGSTSPYTIGIGAIGAYSLQVRYQSTDFVSSTSSARATNPTSMTTSNTNTNAGGNSDRTGGNDNSRDISTGAAVGIVVGAFAGVLIIIAAIWYLIKQKQRQRQPGPSPTSEPQPVIQQEYYAKSSAADYPHELQGGNQIHELPTFDRIQSSGRTHQGELLFNTQA